MQPTLYNICHNRFYMSHREIAQVGDIIPKLLDSITNAAS